jgi:hypothetical protein
LLIGSSHAHWTRSALLRCNISEFFSSLLEEFFVNYHDLSGKEYRILGVKGPGAAKRSVEKGLKAVKRG